MRDSPEPPALGKAVRILALVPVARRVFRCVGGRRPEGTAEKFRLGLLCAAFARPYDPVRLVRSVRFGFRKSDAAAGAAVPRELSRHLAPFRLHRLSLHVGRHARVEDFFELIQSQRESLRSIRASDFPGRAELEQLEIREIPLGALEGLRSLDLRGPVVTARLLALAPPSLASLSLRRWFPKFSKAKTDQHIHHVAQVLLLAKEIRRLSISPGHSLTRECLGALWETLDQKTRERLEGRVGLPEYVLVDTKAGSLPWPALAPAQCAVAPTFGSLRDFVRAEHLRSLHLHLTWRTGDRLPISISDACSFMDSLALAPCLGDLRLIVTGPDHQLLSFFRRLPSNTFTNLLHLRRLRLFLVRSGASDGGEGEAEPLALRLPASLVVLELEERWLRGNHVFLSSLTLPPLSALADAKRPPPLALGLAQPVDLPHLRSLVVKGHPHYVSRLLAAGVTPEQLEWRGRYWAETDGAEGAEVLRPNHRSTAHLSLLRLIDIFGAKMPDKAKIISIHEVFVSAPGDDVRTQWERRRAEMRARLAALPRVSTLTADHMAALRPCICAACPAVA